jgi:hypothetical protein
MKDIAAALCRVGDALVFVCVSVSVCLVFLYVWNVWGCARGVWCGVCVCGVWEGGKGVWGVCGLCAPHSACIECVLYRMCPLENTKQNFSL